jgi:biotin carboxyl carrier protein
MSDTLRVRVNDRWYTVEAVDVESEPAVVLVDGERVEVSLSEPLIRAAAPPADAPASQIAAPAPVPAPAPAAAPSAGGRAFTSPMPGIVLSIAVSVGDQVTTGDDICVLEAMKMQQTLKADWSGVVSAVHVIPGQQVQDGDAIVELG